jgi:hypothetical protein
VDGRCGPITGSFSVDITFIPQQRCGFELIDTRLGDEEDDALVIVCSPSDPIRKIDRILVKFEADLLLTMSISGLELTSSTSFTFKGVEAQLFFVKATVGAMVFETALVFAPNIIEFEEVRSGSGTRTYCLNRTAPVNWAADVGPPLAGHIRVGVYPAGCIFGSGAGILDPVYGYSSWGELFFLSYTEVSSGPIANLVMANWFDSVTPKYATYIDTSTSPPEIELQPVSLTLPARGAADLTQEGRGSDAQHRGVDAGPAHALCQLRHGLRAELQHRHGAHPPGQDRQRH